MGKVIQFPIPSKNQDNSRIDVELEISKDILKSVISQISSYGIRIDDNSPLFEDLVVMFNILYAILLRDSNHYHPWQDMLDEMLMSLRGFYDDYDEHHKDED